MKKRSLFESFKYSLFSKVKTKKHANDVIREGSYGFMLVGAILVLVSLFVGEIDPLIQGIIFLLLGFALFRSNSFAISVVLLGISILGVVLSLFNLITNSVGQSIIIAVILLWISIRVVQATSYFRKYQR